MKKIFGVICVLSVLILPTSANAYFTNGQNVIPLGDTAAIYTISYAFGLSKSDVYMPISVTRDFAQNSEMNNIGYEIRENGKNPTSSGTALGIVVSPGTEIVDGMYRIPKGERRTFKIIVLFQTDLNIPKAEYSMRATDLPFYTDTDGTRERKLLGKSILQFYKTPGIEFGI